MRQCQFAGLVSAETIHIDARLIRANVSMDALVARHLDAIVTAGHRPASWPSRQHDLPGVGARAAGRWLLLRYGGAARVYRTPDALQTPPEAGEGSSTYRFVHDHLAHRRWSPEQIAHRLRLTEPDNPSARVSHETICAAICAQPRGGLKAAMVEV